MNMRRALCACLPAGLSILVLYTPTWAFSVPDMNFLRILTSITSLNNADFVWKQQCGTLVNEAESAIISGKYETALEFLHKYEAVPCKRESVDSKVWRYIGQIHYEGAEKQKNIPEAVKYLTKAAEAKDAKAQCSLGLLLLNEQNDYQNAIFWLDQSAAQGNTRACYNIGNLYANENSPCRNLEKAAKYYAIGAGKKDINCTYELGLLYYDGEGVDKNLETAQKHLTYAAKYGNADAAYILAWMLLHDITPLTTKNIEDAYLWFETAKYFKSKLFDKGNLENCFKKELSAESKAKVDKKLERFVSLIILSTQD